MSENILIFLHSLGKIRLFLSLNIESELQQTLAEIQVEVKKQLQSYRIKWVKPENFHLTLIFIGDTPIGKVGNIIESLSEIYTGFDEILTQTSEINFFPNAQKPTVIYLGLTDEQNRISTLANYIDNVLKDFGFISDKKFVPHISFGRFRRESKTKIPDGFYPGVIRIQIKFKSFFLMKSTLSNSGSEYKCLREFPFISRNSVIDHDKEYFY